MVGIYENIFVCVSIVCDKIKKIKMVHSGKKLALVQQWENFPLVAADQVIIDIFFPVSFSELHSVFFCKTFYLTVSQHRQPRHSCHQHTNAKILVTFAKLVYRGAFIGVVHKVYITLKNLGFEFKRVTDQLAITGVILITQHIHKGAVVNPVHTQCAHEVSFHQPEGFSQEQCVRGFDRGAVYKFAPEFYGHRAVKFLLGHAVLGTGRYGTAATRLWEPESLVVLFRQGHCGIRSE